jgi:hypothetical protein
MDMLCSFCRILIRHILFALGEFLAVSQNIYLSRTCFEQMFMFRLLVIVELVCLQLECRLCLVYAKLAICVRGSL